MYLSWHQLLCGIVPDKLDVRKRKRLVVEVSQRELLWKKPLLREQPVTHNGGR